MHHFVVCCEMLKPNLCELIQPFFIYPLLLSRVGNDPLSTNRTPFETIVVI